MTELLAALPLVFAQNAAPVGGSSFGVRELLPLLPIPILFYLLMIRPTQLEKKKQLEMINALKKNDKVVTTSGIYGTVVSTDLAHDRVVLRVDDDKGVRVTFNRSSVLKVVETSQEKAAEPA